MTMLARTPAELVVIRLLPLETPRLVLRRFAADDLAAFQAYRSDPELARYQGWQPTSDAEAMSFLAGQAVQELGAPGEWLQVAIARADSGELVGDLGLCVADNDGAEDEHGQPIAAEQRSVELGITLARSAQGRGFASEALRAVLDALLRGGHVARVVAITDARNASSEALLRRVGFEHQQTRPASFRGEACLEHRFEMTSERWGRMRPH
jgi:RimJ/RimL family protein N-acetyltransferase